jgi:YHS domain-containing protein
MLNTHTLKFLTFVLIALTFVPLISQSSLEEGTRTKNFALDSKRVAIQGYDPISYWKGTPKKGESKYSFTHLGAVYYFSSAENMQEFSKSPSKFEPEFGGWCAYAIGESGEKVEVNPKRFKIKDNKLYLFYDGIFGDTLKPWNANEVALKEKAEINWKSILSK